MLPEPLNSILVIAICLLAALHFNGYFKLSKRASSIVWLKNKSPALPAILSILFVIVAVLKAVLLTLS